MKNYFYGKKASEPQPGQEETVSTEEKKDDVVIENEEDTNINRMNNDF